MDGNKRQRGVYVTARQKKKLLEFITKHPELITCKVTQDFNYRDSQKLWMTIANECNSIPGAKKTWRQWRKVTWQDLKSKTKKRHAERNGELSSSLVVLTQAEQAALGLKEVSSTLNYQESTEFVSSDNLEQDNVQDNFNNEEESNPSYSDTPDSPPEEKVFTYPIRSDNITVHKDSGDDSKHSNNCVFSCNILAKQEQRKIDIKENYLNFKKDYLRQKLKLLKEQTEALKSIAKELCNK